MPKNKPQFATHPMTKAVQAGHVIDPATGAVVPPIHPSTTFARGADYAPLGDFMYSRYGMPTVDEAEGILAELDGGKKAYLFASGLAAMAAVFDRVKAGEHIVAPQVMYFGAQVWLKRIAGQRNIGLTFFDQSDPAALSRAIEPGRTALVWIETPANPTWDVTDIAAAADAAHRAGALLGVDSTTAPPPTTRPLDLGADIVFHSATKYLNGHSDVTAGALIVGDNDELIEELWTIRTYSGAILPAFEAWLLIRGLRTLYLRFERASENALAIARNFQNHTGVDAVLYPGLTSHPGHAIARSQMTGGFGGMLSILVKGDMAAAQRVVTALNVFVPATSLGGVESLAELRKAVESPDSLVPENLIRLSVGIEHVDDLIADLDQALAVL